MRYLFLGVLILCFGCSKEQDRDLTFIGGRIVNPTSSYVTLEHNEKLIDTIPLDRNNNFGYEFSQDQESVYSFKHYPESQTIYLKPGDSAVLRVNTMEFDESLSYGGSSSIENNFLINMFLLNEKDNDLILSYYKISPQNFIDKTDSIMRLRLNNLEKLKLESEFTPYFENIAKSTIEYEHFDMRERYAFLMKKYVPNTFDEFPEDYFDYRKQADFNHPDLVSNFSYMRFLDNYLRNKSIEICDQENRDCFDLNDHQNLKRRLNLVHDLFDNDYLRLNFFNRFIRREIVFSQTEEQLKETLAIIKKFDLPSLDEEELHQLTNIQSKYLVGKNLKHLKLRTPGMDTVLLHQISYAKPTVLYTWSAQSSKGKRNHITSIESLRAKYPQINFLSINLDFQNPGLWRNALKRIQSPAQTEYQIISDVPKNTYGFYKNYLNRIYIIDKNYTLINNSTSLFDPKLESHFLTLLNP
ncbi:hypothetical protein G3567_03975 [Psychroflexus sp. YR1-1]|uniref:Thioredoxin domain-containing protein n=1 Tax=Psychroflexus aurantiacus TaxID=2709310 RepID=A0A6B3QZU5_9FLAO|nr:hypothetical protein [Psychroflexus aurantiacus]NEV93308.1 hypothetical protein [Psychroflexus aurantiacus]